VSEVLHTNRYQLYGTAGSWFILDIVFYANGLFSGQVTASMGFGKTPKQESIAALILNVSSWAAAATFSIIIITVRPPLSSTLSLLNNSWYPCLDTFAPYSWSTASV
jgi:hypothetical protein